MHEKTRVNNLGGITPHRFDHKRGAIGHSYGVSIHYEKIAQGCLGRKQRNLWCAVVALSYQVRHARVAGEEFSAFFRRPVYNGAV